MQRPAARSRRTLFPLAARLLAVLVTALLARPGTAALVREPALDRAEARRLVPPPTTPG